MKKIGAVSFVVIVAAGAGFQVFQQAGLFWGIVVLLLVVFFGVLALARIFVREV